MNWDMIIFKPTPSNLSLIHVLQHTYPVSYNCHSTC